MPETTVIYIDDTGAPAVAIIARRAAEQAVVNAEAAADRAEAALGGIIPTLTAPEIAVEGSATVDGPVDGAYSITLVRPQATGTPDPLILLASLTVDGSSALSLLDDLLGFTVPGGAEDLTIEAEWIVYNGVDPQVTSTVTVTLPALVVLTAPAKMAAPTVTADGFDVVRVTRAAAPDDGGSPITGYDMQWSLDEQNWTLVEGFASPYDIAGLADVAGTVYAQTRAVNGVDPGEWSDSGSAVTAIEQPTIVAPTATGSLDDLTLTEGGDAVTADAGALVDDGGGTLAFTLPTKPATGVSIDGATGIITINPSTTGLLAAASVVVRATNEAGSVDLGFSLTVEEAAPGVVAPTAAGALADQTFTQGTGVQNLDASGDFSNGGGTLAFSLPTKPSGVTIDSATGVISFDTATTAVVSGASVVVRAMNSAGSADSGFSLTINAAFAEVAGRVSTGTAQLSIGPVTGTDPAGMAFVGYFTAPAAGFGATTVPWFTSADGSHQAYVSITAAGEAFASIYTRVGGALQAAQTIYFQGDPIQPGERFVLVGSGIAGGSFALRQSRAGADFVDAGSVTIPAGAVFPIYGQEHTFFGAPIISDGVFVFAYGALPGVLGSLAALNAGKASIVAAGGARPTIDTIKAALGTPVYAVYGPAATITTNRGTAGGTYTLTGTITDYVPAVFSPNVVNIANRSTSLTTATRDPVPYALMYGDLTYIAGGMNGTRIIETKSSSDSVRVTGTGQLQAIFTITPPAAAAASQIVTTPTGYVVTDQVTPFVFEFDGPAGAMRLYAAQANGTLAQVGTTPITVGSTIDLSGDNLTLGKSDKTIETSGLGVYVGASRPAGINPVAEASKFFGSAGRIADPAITDAYLGLTLIAGKRSQTAAQWASGLNDGVDGPFGVFAGAGSVTDVATVETNPFADQISIQSNMTEALVWEPVEFEVVDLTDEQRGTWGFKWDFGDATAADWNLLADIPADVKRTRQTPIGHRAAYLWDTSGAAKPVSVWCIPPAYSGLAAFKKEITFPVRSYAEQYATATEVWAVSGNGSFAWVPAEFAGCQQVTNIKAAHDAAWVKENGLILLDPAQVYTPSDSMSFREIADQTGRIVYRTAGDPRTTKAEIDVSANGWNSAHHILPKSVSWQGVRFRGNYNPNTGAGARTSAIRMRNGSDLSLPYCEFIGVKQGLEYLSATNPLVLGGSANAYESQFEEWEDYGIYTSETPRLIVYGCRAFHRSDQITDYDDKNLGAVGNQTDHSFVRTAWLVNGLFGYSFVFSRTGWSGLAGGYVTGTDKQKKTQPAWRAAANGMREDPANNVLIVGTYTEGPSVDLYAGAGTGFGCLGRIVNFGNYNMGTAQASGNEYGHNGIWSAGNVTLIPNSPPESQLSGAQFEGYPNDRVGGATGVSAAWSSGTQRFSGNTVAYMRSAANDTHPRTLGEISGRASFETALANGGQQFDMEGELIVVPNTTPSGQAGPVEPAGGMTYAAHGPEARYNGFRQEQLDGSVVFKPEYATPAGSSVLPVPAGDPTYTPTIGHALDYKGNVRRAVTTLGAIDKAPLADPT